MQGAKEFRTARGTLSVKKKNNDERAVTGVRNKAMVKSRSLAGDKPFGLSFSLKQSKVVPEGTVIIATAKNICSLPTEVLLKIFTLLPSMTLLSCALTCKQWNIVASDWSLWKALYARHFPSAFERSLEINVGIQDWRALFVDDAARHAKENFLSPFWWYGRKHIVQQTRFELVLLLKGGCYHTTVVPKSNCYDNAMYLHFRTTKDVPKIDDVLGIRIYFFLPTMCGEGGSARQAIRNSPMRKRLIFREDVKREKMIDVSHIRNNIAEFVTEAGASFVVRRKTSRVLKVCKGFHEQTFGNEVLPLDVTTGCPNCQSIEKRHHTHEPRPSDRIQTFKFERMIPGEVVMHCVIPNRCGGSINFYHKKYACDFSSENNVLMKRNGVGVPPLDFSMVLTLIRFCGDKDLIWYSNKSLRNVHLELKIVNKTRSELIVTDKDVELIYTSGNAYSEHFRILQDIVRQGIPVHLKLPVF